MEKYEKLDYLANHIKRSGQILINLTEEMRVEESEERQKRIEDELYNIEKSLQEYKKESTQK